MIKPGDRVRLYSFNKNVPKGTVIEVNEKEIPEEDSSRTIACVSALSFANIEWDNGSATTESVLDLQVINEE